MNLNEEIDCNAANPESPAAREPAQCGHHLRCGLLEGHGQNVRTIADEHWAPHGGAQQARVPNETLRSSSGVYWKSEASLDGGRQLPVDDLALGEEVLELARKILADPHRTEHLVDIKDDSWVCQHPIKERVEGTMLACPYSDVAIMEQLWRYYEDGRYRIVRVNDVDTLEPIVDSPEDGETDG